MSDLISQSMFRVIATMSELGELSIYCQLTEGLSKHLKECPNCRSFLVKTLRDYTNRLEVGRDLGDLTPCKPATPEN
jgi:hypothetical protein